MKKLISLLLLFPFVALATPVSWDKVGSVLQPLQNYRNYTIKVDHLNATSTTATSTFAGATHFGGVDGNETAPYSWQSSRVVNAPSDSIWEFRYDGNTANNGLTVFNTSLSPWIPTASQRGVGAHFNYEPPASSGGFDQTWVGTELHNSGVWNGTSFGSGETHLFVGGESKVDLSEELDGNDVQSKINAISHIFVEPIVSFFAGNSGGSDILSWIATGDVQVNSNKKLILEGALSDPFLTKGDSYFTFDSGTSKINSAVNGSVAGSFTTTGFDVPSGKLLSSVNASTTLFSTTNAYIDGVAYSNNLQVLRLPDQSSFIGSIIYGNGGGSIANTSATDGDHLTFVGVEAGNLSTTGTDNTFVGWQAGRANTTGSDNTYLGAEAGENNQTASFNTMVGVTAGQATVGGSNTFVGHQAGQTVNAGTDNVAFGPNALRLCNSTNSSLCSYNMAIGQESLNTNRTGNRNVGIGYRTSYNNNSATSTIAIGYQAGRGATTFSGQEYVAIGDSALTGLNGAGVDGNVAIGTRAGDSVTSGDGNLLLGWEAGENITTGSTNIAIGYDVDAPSATASDQLTIGNLIFGTGLDGRDTTVSSGSIGIGTAAPAALLHVNSPTATSTVYVTSGGAGLGGRLILEDVDAAGCTEVTALNGVLTAQIVTCP